MVLGNHALKALWSKPQLIIMMSSIPRSCYANP